MYQTLFVLQALLQRLVDILQPILVPLCFVGAWFIIALAIWNTLSAVRDGVKRAETMHQIPCPNCKFFTDDYHLKCPVRPTDAMSETAINCPDFEAAGYYSTKFQNEIST